MTSTGVRLWTKDEYHRMTEAGIIDPDERSTLSVTDSAASLVYVREISGSRTYTSEQDDRTTNIRLHK